MFLCTLRNSWTQLSPCQASEGERLGWWPENTKLVCWSPQPVQCVLFLHSLYEEGCPWILCTFCDVVDPLLIFVSVTSNGVRLRICCLAAMGDVVAMAMPFHNVLPLFWWIHSWHLELNDLLETLRFCCWMPGRWTPYCKISWTVRSVVLQHLWSCFIILHASWWPSSGLIARQLCISSCTSIVNFCCRFWFQ